jgi:hypothetical protein
MSGRANRKETAMEGDLKANQIHAGVDVYGSDEKKIGKVIAVDSLYLTVERGLLSKSDYYIPISAVNNLYESRVYLKLTKDDALRAGWDSVPIIPTDAGEPPAAPTI